MKYFTSVYGGKYLPFLRAFLQSLTQQNADADVFVAWDDIADLEIQIISSHFPSVKFEQWEHGVQAAQDVHQRIPMKLRYWQKFLSTVDEGEVVAFLDVDTLIMHDLSTAMPDDADVVYTWKLERFPLNTGVMLVRANSGTLSFMQEFTGVTESIIADNVKLKNACNKYGAADQFALAQILPNHDFTNECERAFGPDTVRFFPVSAHILNETNSMPIVPEVDIFHLKSGWHSILLEDGPYTKWRTHADCDELQHYWSNADLTTSIDSWSEFCMTNARRHQDQFPEFDDDKYVTRGILNSEMLMVISLLKEMKIDVVIESGRYLGQSTKVLAEALKGTRCEIHSTELNKDEIAEEAERRLAGYENLFLYYGDAADAIPEIVASHKGKRVAMLLDGPKGPPAFKILSDAIAEYDEVVVGFIHDLRNSYPGSMNPNRILVHDWFERIFFTDDEQFVKEFSRLDDDCHIPGFWEPYEIAWRKAGSYGPTLGVIGPTERDRLRARKRMQAVSETPPSPTPLVTNGKAWHNPLRKLHRVPGFSATKDVLKRTLGRNTQNAGNGYQSAAAPNGNDAAARTQLSQLVAVGPGDIIVDCGANVGQEVSEFVETGAMIYAFEPNPHAFAVLKEKFGQYPNVVCFPFAVLDHEDTVRLYMHEWAEQDEVKWSVGSSVVESKGNVRADNYVEVRAIDLSEFLYRFNTRIKLLKMDIEGAEYPTLTKILERGIAVHIDHVVVETHAQKIPELQPAHAALVELVETSCSTNVDLTWI